MYNKTIYFGLSPIYIIHILYYYMALSEMGHLNSNVISIDEIPVFVVRCCLPSGKRLHNYKKIQFLMAKSTN